MAGYICCLCRMSVFPFMCRWKLLPKSIFGWLKVKKARSEYRYKSHKVSSCICIMIKLLHKTIILDSQDSLLDPVKKVLQLTSCVLFSNVMQKRSPSSFLSESSISVIGRGNFSLFGHRQQSCALFLNDYNSWLRKYLWAINLYQTYFTVLNVDFPIF